MARDKDDEMPEVDPVDLVRSVLRISPEDAAKVREKTPGTRTRISHDQKDEDPVE